MRPPEVLVSDPRSPLFAPLANLYLEDGMVDEAIQLCLSGLENYPDSLDGHLVLGKAYLKKGDMDLARDELKMVLSLDGANEEAKRSLTRLEAKVEIPPEPLTEALDELRRIEGVLGVLVLEEGGSVVYEDLDASIEEGKTGHLLGSLFAKAERTLSEIDFGNLRSVIMEMGKRRAYLVRVGSSMLALLTERSAMMGLMMLQLKRVLPKIETKLLQKPGD